MGLDAVRVQVVDLDALAAGAADASDADTALLDAAERERAARLGDPRDRRRYVLAHAQLRRLLGEATGRAPADVRLTREPCASCGAPHGRPVTPGVRFSLSRSGAFAAIALADEPCGVDIEVAQDPARLAGVALLAPGERTADPLLTWVRKEALLKATGEGLTRSMQTLRADEARAEGRVRDLVLPAGLVGAVAVAGGGGGVGDVPSASPAFAKVQALRLPPESVR